MILYCVNRLQSIIVGFRDNPIIKCIKVAKEVLLFVLSYHLGKWEMKGKQSNSSRYLSIKIWQYICDITNIDSRISCGLLTFIIGFFSCLLRRIPFATIQYALTDTFR